MESDLTPVRGGISLSLPLALAANLEAQHASSPRTISSEAAPPCTQDVCEEEVANAIIKNSLWTDNISSPHTHTPSPSNPPNPKVADHKSIETETMAIGASSLDTALTPNLYYFEPRPDEQGSMEGHDPRARATHCEAVGCGVDLQLVLSHDCAHCGACLCDHHARIDRRGSIATRTGLLESGSPSKSKYRFCSPCYHSILHQVHSLDDKARKGSSNSSSSNSSGGPALSVVQRYNAAMGSQLVALTPMKEKQAASLQPLDEEGEEEFDPESDEWAKSPQASLDQHLIPRGGRF